MPTPKIITLSIIYNNNIGGGRIQASLSAYHDSTTESVLQITIAQCRHLNLETNNTYKSMNAA